ncbi:hypothetical protein JCM8202_004055 [Rhodotorula sphaerocarpa]
MSRVTHAESPSASTAQEADAAMGSAGEEGGGGGSGAASSSESSVVDDLMRDDELAADDDNEDDNMLTELGNGQVAASPSAGPSIAYPPSPSGPPSGSSRRAGGRPQPGRTASGATTRPSRRELAAQAFTAGGGEFDRERAIVEGRRGGRLGGGGEGDGGEGRSAEEIALAKVVDKEYAGKLNHDPFWPQVCAMRQAKAARAGGAGIAPSASASDPTAPTATPAAAGPSPAMASGGPPVSAYTANGAVAPTSEPSAAE